MKFTMKLLPQYMPDKNGKWYIYNYVNVLVPEPESKKEIEILEE